MLVATGHVTQVGQDPSEDARQDAIRSRAFNAVDAAFAANRLSISGGDENVFIAANHVSIPASNLGANHASIVANHASMPGGGEGMLHV